MIFQHLFKNTRKNTWKYILNKCCLIFCLRTKNTIIWFSTSIKKTRKKNHKNRCLKIYCVIICQKFRFYDQINLLSLNKTCKIFLGLEFDFYFRSNSIPVLVPHSGLQNLGVSPAKQGVCYYSGQFQGGNHLECVHAPRRLSQKSVLGGLFKKEWLCSIFTCSAGRSPSGTSLG